MKLINRQAKPLAPNADPIAAARLTRDTLQNRLTEIGAKLEELRSARRDQAFAAKASGDAAAQRTLDALADAERALEIEHRDTIVAAEEAQRRVAAAEKAFADARAQANRAAIAENAKALRAHFEKADELLGAFVAELTEAQGLLHNMLRLGAPADLSRLFSRPAINRALHSAGVSAFADMPSMTINGRGASFSDVAETFLSNLIEKAEKAKAA